VPLFTWNDSYLLGVKEFDEHHQHLVDLLNMSFDAFENNTHPTKLEPIIEELIDYATYHFAAEE
jgi:hemerythrin